MSDFTSNGWSIFVGALTLLGLIACLALLAIAARLRVAAGVDDNTTGHVWDEDLRELNNPLPRWWMGLFVITVLFSLAYLFLYPGFGAAAGSLQWTSTGEHAEDDARARAAQAPLYARFAAMDEKQLAADTPAMAIGERLFINHCATCHGSDARGSKGFPNLADSDWLWGGGFDDIRKSITEGRNGVMPPMAEVVGGGDNARQVAHYVLSLSASPHDSVLAQLGRARFTACAACHGADGKGNTALGAPNLTDAVWLHGWGEEAIVAIVNGGKSNAMPAHGARLSAEQVRVLAAYVWRLSHGGGP
jgi:cytochrome c oxidase cbb3-type subunit III